MKRLCTTHFHSLIAFILLSFCHCATAGSFVSPPENVTVYSGQTARFTCKVTQSGQSGIYWRITKKRLQPMRLSDFYQARSWDPEDIDDDYTSSRALEMIGTSETDNTSVECEAYYLNPNLYILSDRVYLRVQGILDAPSNLASSVMNDSVLVTWTPPSTLPGTTMSFTINVSIGDQSETFTTSQHNFLIGLRDLSINSSCYSNCELSVSVKCMNEAGEGEATSITQPFSYDEAGNDLMPHLIENDTTENNTTFIAVTVTVGATIVVLILAAAILGAYVCVKRINNDYSKQSSIETGKNPSYGDAPPLTKNPCYEEPHQYESIDPVYCTIIEVKVQRHPTGVPSQLYPAHENA